ncbi:MAB_1171c family putative transporter [Sciscionella sediminilitoris]|uniref:MAB_1171c family putative transporter n=1 Tax=Sciscionella sediminilitoris TaxID=1445613 RepID=UPI0004DF71F1|nr:MAB_1171c family putative transporter [Sciscionella sp. SE31]
MNGVAAAAFLLSAIASSAAFLYKLVQIHRNWRDVVYVSLTVTLAWQFLTFAMGVVSTSSASLFGVPNLSVLVLHVVAVALCISAQILLLLWANPLEKVRGRIRGWLVTGVLIIAVLVALFFIGGAVYLPSTDLTVGSADPVILTYLLLFIASQLVPCVKIAIQCIPYARAAGNPWLRRGLWLLSIAAVLLVVYCLTRTVNILSPALHIEPGIWKVLPNLFSAVGIVVMSIALTMPSWGGHVTNAVGWLRDYRSYRALYPLWHSLYEATPEIALEPPSSSISDLHYRLYRRVVEIRDGWRALRPYMESESESETPADQVRLEARKIKQALETKRTDPRSIPAPSRGGFEQRDAKTFAAEVSWLKEVSHAFASVRD